MSDTMPTEAGRELNALVHKQVMGIVWDESRCRVCGWALASRWELGCVVGNCSMRQREFHGNADEPPAYSENIRLAWEVVEAMGHLGFWLTLQSDWHMGDFCAVFRERQNLRGDSYMVKTAPLAICLAALRATTGEPNG